MDKCSCKFCDTYNKYRWATISECSCGCHVSDEIVGHDGLCCEFPNGKKKNNPYNDLQSSEYYRGILDNIENV